MEQQAATDHDRDEEISAKNRKLHKKIDKYKQELNEAKRDFSTLNTQLEQTRQDKVINKLWASHCLFYKFWQFSIFGNSLKCLFDNINHSEICRSSVVWTSVKKAQH